MADRYGMDVATRAAAVSLLEDYRDVAGLKMQVYRARPASVNPPTAFVDRLTSRIIHTAGLFQRTPRAELIVLHGLFDSGEAVDQRDAFVDGFFDWCEDNDDAAGPNTTLELVAIDDIPVYVPDWLPPDRQRAYYGTRIVLEGFAGGA